MATVHCKTQYLHLSTVSVLRQSEWCQGAGPVVLLALLSFPDSPITLLEKRWTPPVRQQLIVCLDVWLDWALATVSALTKQARCLPGHFPVIAWSCRWQGVGKESVKKSLMGRGEWIVRGEKKITWVWSLKVCVRGKPAVAPILNIMIMILLNVPLEKLEIYLRHSKLVHHFHSLQGGSFKHGRQYFLRLWLTD